MSANFQKNLLNFSSFHFQSRALFFQNGHCSSVAAESTHDSKTVKWFILISTRLVENSRLCELPMMTILLRFGNFFIVKGLLSLTAIITGKYSRKSAKVNKEISKKFRKRKAGVAVINHTSAASTIIFVFEFLSSNRSPPYSNRQTFSPGPLASSPIKFNSCTYSTGITSDVSFKLIWIQFEKIFIQTDRQFSLIFIPFDELKVNRTDRFSPMAHAHCYISHSGQDS